MINSNVAKEDGMIVKANRQMKKEFQRSFNMSGRQWVRFMKEVRRNGLTLERAFLINFPHFTVVK